MGTGSVIELLVGHLALGADFRIDIAFQGICGNVRNTQLHRNADLAGEFRHQREAVLLEALEQPEGSVREGHTLGQLAGNTSVQGCFGFHGQGNGNTANAIDSDEAQLDLIQLQRFRQIRLDAVVDIGVANQFHGHPLLRYGDLIFDFGILDLRLHIAADAIFAQGRPDLNGTVQLHLTGRVGGNFHSPAGHGLLSRHGIGIFLSGVLVHINDLSTLFRDKVRKLGIHRALGFHGFIVLGLVHSTHGNDSLEAGSSDTLRLVQAGNPLKVHDEHITCSDGHRIVVNYNARIGGLYPGAIGYLHHILSEGIHTVKVLVNHRSSQNSSCICGHNVCLSLGDGLFRQKCTIHQRKPAPVNGDLNIIGCRNGCRFAEGQHHIRVRLEAQAEIHGNSRKFTGRCCIRIQIAACGNVHNTKLHRQKHIVVVVRSAVQVDKVIVRVHLVLHRHGECFHQQLQPLGPGHRDIPGRCRGFRCLGFFLIGICRNGGSATHFLNLDHFIFYCPGADGNHAAKHHKHQNQTDQPFCPVHRITSFLLGILIPLYMNFL